MTSNSFLENNYNSDPKHKACADNLEMAYYLWFTWKEEFFEAHVKPLWITLCNTYVSSGFSATSTDLEVKFTEREKKFINLKTGKMRNYISMKKKDKNIYPFLKSALGINHADGKNLNLDILPRNDNIGNNKDNIYCSSYLAEWSGETMLQLMLMPQDEIKRKANSFISVIDVPKKDGNKNDQNSIFFGDNEREGFDNNCGHDESDKVLDSNSESNIKSMLNQKNIDVIVKKLLATVFLLEKLEMFLFDINFEFVEEPEGISIGNENEKYLKFYKQLSLSKMMISGMNKVVLDYLFIKLFIPFTVQYYCTVSLFPDEINGKKRDDGFFSIAMLKIISFFSAAPSCLSTFFSKVNDDDEEIGDYATLFENDIECDIINDDSLKQFTNFNFSAIHLFNELDNNNVKDNAKKLKIICNNIFIEKIHGIFFHLFYKKYLESLIKKYNVNNDDIDNHHEDIITIRDIKKIHFIFSLGQMLSFLKIISYNILKLPYEFEPIKFLDKDNNDENGRDDENSDKEEDYEEYSRKLNNNFRYFVEDLKKKSFFSKDLVHLKKYIHTFVDEYYSFLISHNNKIISTDNNGTLKHLLLFENPLLVTVDSSGKLISHENIFLNSHRFRFLFNAFFEYLENYSDIMYSQLSSHEKDERESKEVMIEFFSSAFIDGVCKSLVENLKVFPNVDVIFEGDNKNKGIIAVVYNPSLYNFLSKNVNDSASIPTAAVNIIGTISSAIYHGLELVKANKFRLKDIYKTKVCDFLRRLKFIKIIDNNDISKNKLIDLSLLTSEAIQTIIVFGTDSFKSLQGNDKDNELFSYIALFMSFCTYDCNLNITNYFNIDNYIDNNDSYNGYVYTNTCIDLIINIFSFLYQYNLLKFYDENDKNLMLLARQKYFLSLIKEYIPHIVSESNSNVSFSDVSILKNDNEIIDFFLKKSAFYSSLNDKNFSSKSLLSEVDGTPNIDELIVDALSYSWNKINNNNGDDIFDFKNKNVIYFLIDRFDKDIKKSHEFFDNFAKCNKKVNLITLPSWNWKYFFSIGCNNNYASYDNNNSTNSSPFFTLYLPEINNICDSFSQWWQSKRDSMNKNKEDNRSISFITDINRYKCEYSSIIFNLNLISNNKDNAFIINTNLIIIPAILRFINKNGGKCSLKELIDECKDNTNHFSFYFLKMCLDAIYEKTLLTENDKVEKIVLTKENSINDNKNGQSLIYYFISKNVEKEDESTDIFLNYNYKCNDKSIDITVSRCYIWKKYQEYYRHMGQNELNNMYKYRNETHENQCINVHGRNENYTKNILTSLILKMLKKSSSSFEQILSYCTENKDISKKYHQMVITANNVKAVIEELILKEFIERDGETLIYIPS